MLTPHIYLILVNGLVQILGSKLNFSKSECCQTEETVTLGSVPTINNLELIKGKYTACVYTLSGLG